MLCPTLAELPPPPPGKEGWPWTVMTPNVGPEPTPDSTWPTVSVVTPSLDQGRFLEEAIRSVLLQGYPSLEYVIMDGGSRDASLEVIRRYEPWLTAWSSGPDDGQSAAINDGWRRTSGSVIAYLNADDCYLPGAIETAARAFLRAPDSGMAYGSALIVDAEGRELRRWRAQPFAVAAMLTIGNVVPQPAAFFARGAVDEVGPLVEDWDMIMDYEFVIRVGSRRPSVCIPAPLARFRDHPDSKSRSRLDDLAGELVRFVDGFATDDIPAADLRRIKRRALARIHYERALAAIASDGTSAAIRRSLVRSLRMDPRLAIGRPRQSAYVVKEIAGRLGRPAREPSSDPTAT